MYIYVYKYICYHENNVLSRLSPQWLCGNSFPWVQDVRLHICGTNVYIDMTAKKFAVYTARMR